MLVFSTWTIVYIRTVKPNWLGKPLWKSLKFHDKYWWHKSWSHVFVFVALHLCLEVRSKLQVVSNKPSPNHRDAILDMLEAQFCVVFFFQKNGWNQRIPTSWIQLGKKRLKSTCPRKRCQTLFEMILVFWCVESMLADYNMRFTTFFWWLQDWNLLSHRCKSSCSKRPRCTISLQHELLACLETPETVLVVCVCVLVSCKNA